MGEGSVLCGTRADTRQSSEPPRTKEERCPASLTDLLTTLGSNQSAKEAQNDGGCREDKIRADNEGDVCGHPQRSGLKPPLWFLQSRGFAGNGFQWTEVPSSGISISFSFTAIPIHFKNSSFVPATARGRYPKPFNGCIRPC